VYHFQFIRGPMSSSKVTAMKSNNADLYFYEELNRTVGREQSFQWLISETAKTSSPARSPQRSPCRSPCRTPQVSPPSSPRSRATVEVMAPPPRKYVVPEGGGVRRSRHSVEKIEPAQAPQIDTEDASSNSSASPSLGSLASPLNELSHSLSSLQLQRLASFPVGAGEESRGEKLGLLFTDAAHSVLDQ
jgi:hypothetical protein